MKIRNFAYVIIIGLVGGFALIASTGGTKRAIKKNIIIKDNNHRKINDAIRLLEGPHEVWSGVGTGTVLSPVYFHPWAVWKGTTEILYKIPPGLPGRIDPEAADSIHGDWVDEEHGIQGKFWGYRRSNGHVEYGFWWTTTGYPRVNGTWIGDFHYYPDVPHDTMNGVWSYNSGSGGIWGSR